jgi:hypothetical protein
MYFGQKTTFSPLKLVTEISTKDNLVVLTVLTVLFSIELFFIFFNSGIAFSYFRNYRERPKINFVRSGNLNFKNSYKTIAPLCG